MILVHMPARTGISHALSAVLVVILGPFLREFVEVLLVRREVVPAFEAVARSIATRPGVPFSSDIVSALVYFGAVGLLAFLWGFAYHLNRHGLRN